MTFCTLCISWARVLTRPRLVLVLVMVVIGLLDRMLVHIALMIAIYTVIVGIAHTALGLRRPAQGEVDALGHRL